MKTGADEAKKKLAEHPPWVHVRKKKSHHDAAEIEIVHVMNRHVCHAPIMELFHGGLCYPQIRSSRILWNDACICALIANGTRIPFYNRGFLFCNRLFREYADREDFMTFQLEIDVKRTQQFVRIPLHLNRLPLLKSNLRSLQFSISKSGITAQVQTHDFLRQHNLQSITLKVQNFREETGKEIKINGDVFYSLHDVLQTCPFVWMDFYELVDITSSPPCFSPFHN